MHDWEALRGQWHAKSDRIQSFPPKYQALMRERLQSTANSSNCSNKPSLPAIPTASWPRSTAGSTKRERAPKSTLSLLPKAGGAAPSPAHKSTQTLRWARTHRAPWPPRAPLRCSELEQHPSWQHGDEIKDNISPKTATDVHSYSRGTDGPKPWLFAARPMPNAPLPSAPATAAAQHRCGLGPGPPSRAPSTTRFQQLHPKNISRKPHREGEEGEAQGPPSSCSPPLQLGRAARQRPVRASRGAASVLPPGPPPSLSGMLRAPAPPQHHPSRSGGGRCRGGPGAASSAGAGGSGSPLGPGAGSVRTRIAAHTRARCADTRGEPTGAAPPAPLSRSAPAPTQRSRLSHGARTRSPLPRALTRTRPTDTLLRAPRRHAHGRGHAAGATATEHTCQPPPRDPPPRPHGHGPAAHPQLLPRSALTPAAHTHGHPRRGRGTHTRPDPPAHKHARRRGKKHPHAAPPPPNHAPTRGHGSVWHNKWQRPPQPAPAIPGAGREAPSPAPPRCPPRVPPFPTAPGQPHGCAWGLPALPQLLLGCGRSPER